MWYWNSDNSSKTYPKNLAPLQYDKEIEQTAIKRAEELVLEFGHTRPDGTLCFTAFADDYYYEAENIAVGYGSVDSVMEAWKETNESYDGQGHRRNMLSSQVNCVGVACVQIKDWIFWVQEFGYKLEPNTERLAINDSYSDAFFRIPSANIYKFKTPSFVDNISLDKGESTTIPYPTGWISFINTGMSSQIWVSVKYTQTFKSADESQAKVEGRTLTALVDNVYTYIYSYMCYGELKIPVLAPPKSTVTFMDEGSVVSTQRVTTGKTATRPADLVKDNYIFAGWYENEDFSGEAFNFYSKIEKDTTLYANWRPVSTANGQGISVIYDQTKADRYRISFLDSSGAAVRGANVAIDGNGRLFVLLPENTQNQAFSISIVNTKGKVISGKEITVKNADASPRINGVSNLDGLVNVPAPVNAQSAWSRLCGSSRYSTNQALVKEGFSAQDANAVVLATGDGFADALSASGLAGMLSAPVVLTSRNADLCETAKAEIERLNPQYVYIIGSEASISAEAEKGVEALGASVVRLGGANRIETANKIYEQGAGSWGKTAVVTWSSGFADALSMAPGTYHESMPVFLSDDTSANLGDESLALLASGGFENVLLLGQENRVSAKTEEQLKNLGLNVVRLAGNTRIETSIQITKWTLANCEGVTCDNMLVARADTFPDALGGGALAGKRNTVLLLAEDSENGLVGAYEIVYGNSSSISKGYFLGDENSLNENVQNTFESVTQ